MIGCENEIVFNACNLMSGVMSREIVIGEIDDID
jgi:hypothetical protein